MSLTRVLLRPASTGRAVRATRLGFSQHLIEPKSGLLLRELPRARLSTDAFADEAPNQPTASSPPERRYPIINGPAEFPMRIVSGKNEISFHPGEGRRTRRNLLHNIWLRDNCRCSLCVNPSTQQRHARPFEFTSKPLLATDLAISSSNDSLIVEWNDGHVSEYSFRFLNRYLNFDNLKIQPPGERNVKPWYFGSEGYQGPNVKFSAVMTDDSGVAELLNKIRIHGFAFVTDTPYHDAEPTRELLERIAFIRITHYGGFYDFIPDLAMADTAYTNLALPAHTDTTYFTDPAGLQAFHLLSHHSPPGDGNSSGANDSLGGASLLVDGFRAAKILQKNYAWAYELLSAVRLPWHASGNKGISITPDRLYPVLEHNDLKMLHRIRWNMDDRGVVPYAGRNFDPRQWYRAASIFDSILNAQNSQYWVQLKPGTTLIFDNWRVLHGRSAFTGVRRICGGYINRDDYISRWRNLFHKNREDLMANVVG